MKKNEALYQLIHSLTPNEKRFFKFYTTRHIVGGENNYIKLFSMFDKMKIYDDEELEKQAKKAKFVNYFSAEKNYLYNLILDSLDSYHKESSIDRQISKMLNIGRILMEKKLDIHGEKVLEKARKLSQFHNRYENIIPINYLLKKKAFARETIEQELLFAYQEEEREVQGKLQHKFYYQQCFDQLLLLRRRQGYISDAAVLENWIDQYPHLTDELKTNLDQFDEAIYYWSSCLEYARINRQKERGKICAHLIIDLLESNRPKIAGEYMDRYIYTLYVYLVMRLYDSEEEANKALHKLENLEQYVDVKVSKNEHARCFEFYFTAITDMRMESKDYQDVWNLIPRIERQFDFYEPLMTPSFILVLHFNITCLLFSLKEYKHALKWLNKVRNVSTDFRADIFHDLRTLNLIIHLELGNDDLLPNLILSANYHNKKEIETKLLQRTIIKYIKLLLKTNINKQREKIYMQLNEELEVLKNNPKENAIFLEVDLLAWVKGKLKST
jgi:hypothetical protein